MKTTRIRLHADGLQVRSNDDGSKTFTGRAVAYGEWSHLLYSYFREMIRPGAFAEHLAEGPDVICCVDHDCRKLLGRTSSGTLKLTDGPEGLDVEVAAPRTSYAEDLAEMVARKDYRGMSFVFDVVDDDWGTRDGHRAREVKKGKLYEVSFVVEPAYPQTTAGVREFREDPAETKMVSVMRDGEAMVDDAIIRMKQWIMEQEISGS